MKKTIKSVIGGFNLQKLHEKNEELHAMGTPRVFIDAIKATIAQYESGDFQVKGLTKKYQVSDTAVKNVYIASAITYNWALPARGDEVGTEILYLQTEDGGYYYNYFNNTIGKTLDEISIKPDSASEFTSFLLPEETEEMSNYLNIKYTVSKTSPVFSVVINTFGNESKAVKLFKANTVLADIVSAEYFTKAEAIKRGYVLA